MPNEPGAVGGSSVDSDKGDEGVQDLDNKNVRQAKLTLLVGIVCAVCAVTLLVLGIIGMSSMRSCDMYSCNHPDAALVCCVQRQTPDGEYDCLFEPIRGNITDCAAWDNAPMVAPAPCDTWKCSLNGGLVGVHRTSSSINEHDDQNMTELTAVVVSASGLLLMDIFLVLGAIRQLFYTTGRPPIYTPHNVV